MNSPSKNSAGGVYGDDAAEKAWSSKKEWKEEGTGDGVIKMTRTKRKKHRNECVNGEINGEMEKLMRKKNKGREIYKLPITSSNGELESYRCHILDELSGCLDFELIQGQSKETC